MRDAAGQDLYAFGGSEEQVRSYQRRFISFFAPPGPVLDVGCGRGTFLELLRNKQIEAYGVDTSPGAIETCHQKGFRHVEQGDALTYLSDVREQFTGIYCGHVIEHMTSAEVHQFLRLAWQALKPGGRLLVVTPNPLDLRVISEYFWLDTTHVRPYPLRLLENMLKNAEFNSVSGSSFRSTRPGKRELPRYLLLRLLLGKHYGLSDTYVTGEKSKSSGQS
jgi:2-polyprenyl-3-methyl-5-hydroxy-6-metoxy-1,4-benzoquinol methylase